MTDSTYEPNEGQPLTEDKTPEHSEADGPQPDAAAAVAALQDENASLNDRVLRLAAELENLRRRAEREKAEASRYAIGAFARDLLPVADNFERALAAAPDAVEDSLEGFMTGVRMTERELIKTLERHGLVRVDPVGEKFDPNRHQAVAQAPAPGVPAGHVAQTAQSGFILGDRVLRAAMVVVSTGGDVGDGPGGGDHAPGRPDDRTDGPDGGAASGTRVNTRV